MDNLIHKFFGYFYKLPMRDSRVTFLGSIAFTLIVTFILHVFLVVNRKEMIRRKRRRKGHPVDQK